MEYLIIISVIIVALVIVILKNTHVQVLDDYRLGKALVDEYNLKLPIWLYIVIVIIGFLPLANIIIFSAFLIWYVIHLTPNPEFEPGEVYVFSPRGEGCIIKVLLWIKSALTYEI